MSFTFNPWMLPYAGGLVASLLILLYTAKIPFQRRYHEVFGIRAAIWAVILSGFAMARMSSDPDTYLPIIKIVVFAAPATSILGYHFALEFVSPQLSRLRRYSLFAAYVLLSIFWGTILLDPNLAFTGTRRGPLGYIVLRPAPLDPVPTSLLLIFNFLAIIVLFRYYVSHESPVMKAQTRYLLAGGLLFLFFNASGYLARQFGVIALDFLFPVGVVVQYMGFRKHGFGPVASVAEAVSVAPVKFNLSSGVAYLALEQEPSRSFEAFVDLIQHGHFGFCITRSSPDLIRQSYKLEKTPIRWLAAVRREDAIEPRDLLGLSLTIGRFLQSAPASVVMLHGIEYLASVNGFKSVLQLVQRLNDVSVERQGILLLPLVPGSLGEKAQGLLIAECTRLPIPSPKT